MRIPLRFDWEDRISGKAKPYLLETKDRAIINVTFDQLHSQNRLQWTTSSTPFSYPVFIIWKTLPSGERKGRAVINIRGFNQFTLSNAYPIPSQNEIINEIQGHKYITVVNAASFFYQYKVHKSDYHKLTIVTHRGQETFQVPVMGYKGSPAYVQRQIDRILRCFKFARVYIDDVVIFFKTLEKHLDYLRQTFAELTRVRISLQPTKSFIKYPSVSLLGQYIDRFGLITAENKFKAITALKFPYILKELETYIGITGWLRQYVPYYLTLAAPL